MNSVQQTILGVILVGLAFVLGSHLNGNNQNETASLSPQPQIPSNFQWQGDVSTPQLKHNFESSQPSVQRPLKEANLVPDLATSSADMPRLSTQSKAIVEPDFSRYAINDIHRPAERIAPPQPDGPFPHPSELVTFPPDVDRPVYPEEPARAESMMSNYPYGQSDRVIAQPQANSAPIEIAQPDFAQHFPGELKVNQNVEFQAPPKPPESDSPLRLRRPDLEPVVTRYQDFDSVAPPNPNRLQPLPRTQATSNLAQSVRPNTGGSVFRRPSRFDRDERFRPIVPNTDSNAQSQHGVQPNETISSGQGPGVFRKPKMLQTNVVAISDDRSPIIRRARRYSRHRTESNETLQELAIKYYGDSAYYLDIYVANQNTLRNPGPVPAGIDLRIPVYEN